MAKRHWCGRYFGNMVASRWVLFLFLALLFINHKLSAADSLAHCYRAAISYNTGVICDPGYRYQHLIQGFVNVASVDFGWRTSGQKAWHSFYNFPMVGIRLQYVNLPNRGELGYFISVLPYAEFVAMRHRLVYPFVKGGIGIAYANKPFNLGNNYRNVFIGSHINAAILAGGGVHVNLSPIEMSIAYQLMHFSNGNTRLPNTGMNVSAVNIGLAYYFGQYQKKEMPDEYRKIKKIYISSLMSFTNHFKGVDKGFNYINFMCEYMFQRTTVWGLGAGTDLSINNTRGRRYQYLGKFQPQDDFTVGTKGLVRVSLSPVHLISSVGVQWYPGWQIYEWFNIRIDVYKNIQLSFAYRLYLKKGDHLSVGLAYGI